MAYLTSGNLPNESTSLFLCEAIRPKTKAFDMCMGCGTTVASIALDLADLNHDEETLRGRMGIKVLRYLRSMEGIQKSVKS